MEFVPLGQTREIKTYNQEKMPRSPQSQPSGNLLRHLPVVTPEEMPKITMYRIFTHCDKTTGKENEFSYEAMKDYLSTYQRQGDHRSWDVFREKIPDVLLKAWGDVLIECRRNGFVGPRAEGEEIVFRQIISTNNRQGDLCTFCARPCKRREQIESGEMKYIKLLNKNNPQWEEPKPCWIKTREVGAREVGEEG